MKTKLLIQLFANSFAFVLAQSLHAQDISNSVSFYIPNGVAVYTGGTIANDGFLQNNGAIHFRADWKNTSIYQGTGMVSLEGQQQVLFNNNQSIAHLRFNGAGVKVISGRITVTSQIDFVEGVVVVADADTLLLQDAVSVSGGSPQSYVDGMLIQTGTGYKVFPIGKAGEFHPVELSSISGVEPVIGLEVEQNLPLISTSVKVHPFSDFYWTSKTLSGKFIESPIALGYAVPDSIPASRLAIVYSPAQAGPFLVTDLVTLSGSGSNEMTATRIPVNGIIYALAVLPTTVPRKYYMSTTLSPHASDPENRSVRIMGDIDQAGEFYFQVFNRWGLMIFDSSSARRMTSDGWDGRQDGNPLPSGAYPFSLRYTSVSGNKIHQNGFITIIN